MQEQIMKRLILIAALMLPLPGLADYMDVIEFKLNEGCSFDEYLEIVEDFNETWGKKNGYTAEVAVPLYSNDLVNMFWVGRTEDATSFGKAWDAWRDEQADSDSTAAQLSQRFEACETNLGRRGYDLY
jgi:hypothetical protein